VSLQARAAAALVAVEGREVVEAAALLAEALAAPLAHDAVHLRAPARAVVRRKPWHAAPPGARDAAEAEP